MELIRVEEVSKNYAAKAALRGVSLSVKEGEVYGIMGPNGSGKTTLLRLIDLLEAPSEGRVLIDGVDGNRSEAERVRLRRRMAFVFQHPVNLNTTVYRNVAYPLRLRGRSRAEIEEGVRRSLEAVGLSHLSNQHASTLSGGEAQRLAVARAIVYGPEVLLLDEPTANLDPASVKTIEDVVRRLNREWGTTIILVTHNIFQARRLCGRVAFLLNGELVESGTVEEVFTSPRDPRTRAFIAGEMVF